MRERCPHHEGQEKAGNLFAQTLSQRILGNITQLEVKRCDACQCVFSGKTGALLQWADRCDKRPKRLSRKDREIG